MKYVKKYIRNEKIEMIEEMEEVLIVVIIVVQMIKMKIEDLIIERRIGEMERKMGLILGDERGVIMVVVEMMLLKWIVKKKKKDWVKNEKQKKMID